MDSPASTTPTDDERLLAAISYIYFLAPVMLVLKKNSSFVRFHAKQGFVLFITSIIVWFIPILGWLLAAGVFVGIVTGFVMALNGNTWRMPLVGKLTERF